MINPRSVIMIYLWMVYEIYACDTMKTKGKYIEGKGLTVGDQRC